MKNITFSATDDTIDGLRRLAAGKNKSLNDLFRQWAEETVAEYEAKERASRLKSFDELTGKGPLFVSERKYTREEMNQR